VTSLETYHVALRRSLPELDSAISRARKALESAKLPAERQKAITARLDDVRHDVDFLRTGNDIHNLHYGSKLFRTLADRVTEICRELKLEAPKVELPPPLPKNGQNHGGPSPIPKGSSPAAGKGK
jgi:hypothetical protein